MKRFYAWRRRRLNLAIDACARKIEHLNEQVSHAQAMDEPADSLEQLRVDTFWRRNDLIEKRTRLPKEAT